MLSKYETNGSSSLVFGSNQSDNHGQGFEKMCASEKAVDANYFVETVTNSRRATREGSREDTRLSAGGHLVAFLRSRLGRRRRSSRKGDEVRIAGILLALPCARCGCGGDLHINNTAR